MATIFEKSIVSTIAYYDMFDYPLTSMEIWKWLQSTKGQQINIRFTLGDVMRVLEESEWLQDRINNKDGFYFLKSHEKNIDIRRARHIPATKKWDKAQKLIKQLRFLPFIKLVGLCNVNPINAVNEKSDIDLFIVVKSGRMWTTRFFATLLYGIQGQWRRWQIANKMCLSFFVTDDYLDFRHLVKKPYDPYFLNWLAIMSPLYEREPGIYKRFKKAKT